MVGGEKVAVARVEATLRELAVETCTPLIVELLERGAPGVHLYTMNYPTAARQIWANLGIGPGSAR